MSWLSKEVGFMSEHNNEVYSRIHHSIYSAVHLSILLSMYGNGIGKL